MSRTLLAALIVLIFARCGGSVTTPTIPAPAPTSPTPLPVIGEQWDLTSTLRSVEGPEQCVGPLRLSVGQSVQYHLTIQRSEETVLLKVGSLGSPAGDEYAGTLTGDKVTASMAAYEGRIFCGATPVSFSVRDELLGYFTADGRVLKAEELITLDAPSGEKVAYVLDWLATRQ